MRLYVGIGLGVLASVVLYGYQRWSAWPCDGRCGEGTSCVDEECRVVAKEARQTKRRRGRKRRGRHRRRITTADAPALKQPKAGDLKSTARGPALGGVDRIDMAEAGGRELSRAEVEQRYRKLDSKIVGCIATAGKGWQLDGASKVTVSFRIERSGQVNRVRVGAPALMQRAGIYQCVAPLVKSLHFPSSARSLIMSYPYRVD